MALESSFFFNLFVFSLSLNPFSKSTTDYIFLFVCRILLFSFFVLSRRRNYSNVFYNFRKYHERVCTKTHVPEGSRSRKNRKQTIVIKSCGKRYTTAIFFSFLSFSAVLLLSFFRFVLFFLFPFFEFKSSMNFIGRRDRSTTIGRRFN